MSKQNNDDLYCKVCVLANELPDFNDAPLSRKEVKEIFSNNQNLNFDVDHDHNYLGGVEIVENYVSKTDEEINDTVIPAGSWLMTLNIVNPLLRAALEEGRYHGVSLETNFTSDVEVTDHQNQRLYYKDVLTKDEMMPVTISFTDKPANMLPIELMSRQQYTAKTRGDEAMSPENDDEVTFLRNFVEKLFTHNEDAVTQKSIGATLQPQTSDTQYNELFEAIIASQKVIPLLKESLDTILTAQHEIMDSLNTLNAQVTSVEGETQSQEETPEEETATTEKEVNNEEEEDAKAEEPVNNEDKGAEESKPEKEAPEKEETSEEAPTSETSEDEDEEDKKKKQSTQKNIRGANTRRPLNIENNKKANDDYKQFMINRSYENLVGRNN